MTTQARELAGIISNAGDLSFIDDVTLKSDSAVLNFGADSDVTLTHVADTALLLNSTRQLQFGDSGTYIHQSADGVLDLVSDTEIELNATTLDINANVDISGTLTVAGALDFGDLDISNVGSIALDTITNDGTDLTLDSSGDIIFDADGKDIILKDGGTEFGRLKTSSTPDHFYIKSAISNNDLIFQGNDGGSSITALTLDMSEAGAATFNDKIIATELDISGNADIDGTLEADVITVDGTALNEYIADTVGAMVGSNTESGITVAYQDGDNTLDFTVGTLNQDTTGTAAIATTVTITDNESTDEDNAIVFTAGGDVDGGNLGLESDGTLTYNPSSGLVTATGFSGNLTGTLQTAAQGNVTSLGTLTALTGGTGDLIWDTDTLVVDSSADRVGIGTTSPQTDLHIFKTEGNVGAKHATIRMGGYSTVGAEIAAYRVDGNSNNQGLIFSSYHQTNGTVDVLTIDNKGAVACSNSARIGQAAITSSSNAVAWDAKGAANAYYLTTENTTFGAPTNPVEGAVISVEIAQGGTAYTVSWNTIYEFAASTAPTITATANKTDIITFRYNGSVWQELGRVQNMAQT